MGSGLVRATKRLFRSLMKRIDNGGRCFRKGGLA